MTTIVKGFIVATFLGATIITTGCSKQSKYEGLLRDQVDAKIELWEEAHEKKLKDDMSTFKDKKEGEKMKAIEEAKSELKYLQYRLKDAKELQ